MSLDFWRNSWYLVANLKYENKIKWLQYNIVRHSLKTNYIVNHFKPTVSPLCYYCGTNLEKNITFVLGMQLCSGVLGGIK